MALFIKLWKLIFEEYFSTYIYRAEMGKIRLFTYSDSRGIEFEVSGFSDKIPQFLIALF